MKVFSLTEVRNNIKELFESVFNDNEVSLLAIN